MRWIVSNVLLAFRIAEFTVTGLCALPIVLIELGMDWVIRKLIETRWLSRNRAWVVSFWIRLLTWILLYIAMFVGLWYMIALVRSTRKR